MMKEQKHLDYLVHDILFREWDPIGINVLERISDEYDAYVPHFSQLLLAHADEFHIQQHLSHLRRVVIGLSKPQTEMDLEIARRLLQARKIASRPVRPACTAQELLERYQLGERDFRESLIDSRESGCLNGTCLNGVILKNSTLACNFTGVSLRGAEFSHSKLIDSNFLSADLQGAKLQGCELERTTFENAEMEGAQFSGAIYRNIVLQEGEVPHW